MLGDSLTEWGDWERLLDAPAHNVVLHNHGIAGDTTEGMLRRVRYVIQEAPDAVLLLGGVNDLYMGAPPAEVTRNLGAIVHNLRLALPQAALYLQSLLPVNATLLGWDANDVIQSINTELKAIAPQHGALYVDVYAAMQDGTGNLQPAYTTDGVHLSARGYEAWAAVLRTVPVFG